LSFVGWLAGVPPAGRGAPSGAWRDRTAHAVTTAERPAVLDAPGLPAGRRSRGRRTHGDHRRSAHRGCPRGHRNARLISARESQRPEHRTASRHQRRPLHCWRRVIASSIGPGAASSTRTMLLTTRW